MRPLLTAPVLGGARTGDWKRLPEFERLLLFKVLRPDRLTAAMRNFVTSTMGKEYTTSQPFNLGLSCKVLLHSCT